MEGSMDSENTVYMDPIAQEHVIVEQTTSLYLDPLDDGKLIEKQTTSLTLETLTCTGGQSADDADDLQAPTEERTGIDDSPSAFFHQCAQRVIDTEKDIEELIKTLDPDSLAQKEAESAADAAPTDDAKKPPAAVAADPPSAQHINPTADHDQTGGLELLDKLHDLHTKYALASRKTDILELNLADLANKIRLLECKIAKQEQQIADAQSRQVEQERILLSPMRNIYLRQFHDQVREGISQKLSKTALYTTHHDALRRRVQEKEVRQRFGLEALAEAELWKAMQEAHAAAPKLFSKAALWNQFVDELLQDDKLVAMLALSPASVRITRYGRGPEQQEDNSFTAHLRNKYVFAELVTRQNDERRPYYTELYEFIYNVDPETMNFKTEANDKTNKQTTEQTIDGQPPTKVPEEPHGKGDHTNSPNIPSSLESISGSTISFTGDSSEES